MTVTSSPRGLECTEAIHHPLRPLALHPILMGIVMLSTLSITLEDSRSLQLGLMDLQGIWEPVLWNVEQKSVCTSLCPLAPEWVHKAFIKMRWPQQRLRVALLSTLNSISATQLFTKENASLKQRLGMTGWNYRVGNLLKSTNSEWRGLGRGWKRLSNENKGQSR